VKSAWLFTKGDIAPCPAVRNTRPSKGFLERTLGEIGHFFRDGFLSDEYARKPGFLQKLDPRVKVVTFLSLLVSVTWLTEPIVILGVYLTILLLTRFSDIPLRIFIPRVWLFIPLFSGIIVLPAIFNVFVPGDPLLAVATFSKAYSIGPIKLPQEIAVTRQGLLSATVFVLRVATSVSLVILLLLTTGWPRLMKALRILKVPQMFTFITSMTHRYIYLLLRLIQETHLAKKSRIIRKGDAKSGQLWIGSQMGITLRRSLKLSEDVYHAQVSRGFTTDVKILDQFSLTRRDMMWAMLCVVFMGVALGLNRYIQ